MSNNHNIQPHSQLEGPLLHPFREIVPGDGFTVTFITRKDDLVTVFIRDNGQTDTASILAQAAAEFSQFTIHRGYTPKSIEFTVSAIFATCDDVRSYVCVDGFDWYYRIETGQPDVNFWLPASTYYAAKKADAERAQLRRLGLI